MGLILLPLPADALRDPQKWNSDWDVLLRREFALPRGPLVCFQHQLQELERTPNRVDEALGGLQELVSSTCAVQRNITSEALHHFTHDNFESRWMLAGADVRGKHILGAMAAVCSKSGNLNEARRYCPEIRLMRLRLDGKVFLNLVKSVMLGDASFIPSEPTYVSHPGWDAWAATQRNINDSEAKKIALEEILILRTKLICHIVQFTIRSFFGKDPPQLIVSKEHKSIQNPKAKRFLGAQAKIELVAALGPEAGKARAKEDNAGTMARISERLGHCSYLGCTKFEPEDGSVKFARCKPCFEQMQRQVLYCSPKCQKADWKLRHKAVCCKPLDFETVTKAVEHPISASTSDTRIGSPIDGFKRSIALTAQVTALNVNPAVDYQLYDGHNQPLDVDFGADTYPQWRFRVNRELAMTTGDRTSVARMAHFICAMWLSKRKSDRRGITPNMIVAQLAREFAFDGLRDAVLAMQQLQNADPLRRTPLLVSESLTPDQWASLSQGINLSNMVVTLD
ncbi:hypothetical protein B0H19DRAFT_1247324 [Mycena capillaripes]|nr:hypothetical protein B0H19DRAFT_1247324 [Mycena capillaripes]